MEIMLLIKELPNNFFDELPKRNYKKTHVIKAIGKLLFREEDGTAENILRELKKETKEIDERPGEFRRGILFNPQRKSHLSDEGLIFYTKDTKEKTGKEAKGEKYHFFPSAIIYKKSGKILLDLTEDCSLEEVPDVLKEKIKIKCKDLEVSLRELLYDISIILSEIKILNEIEIMRELMEYVKNKDANFFNNNNYSDIKKDIYNFYKYKIFELPTSIPLYTIGDLTLNFILWWGTGKKGEESNYENITCECVNVPLQTPKEILSMMEKIIDERRKNAKEHGQVFDNNPGYRLIKITPTRRFFPLQKIRKLEFLLTFTQTDFFTCASTNLSVDKLILEDYRQNKISIRRKYVKNQNLSDSNYCICLANPF